MLSYLLCKISISDLKSFQIPDGYSAFIAFAGMVITLHRNMSGGIAFASGALLFRVIIAEILFLATGLIMGLGDAKLFAALSLVFGAKIFYIFIGSLFTAGIYCAALVLTKHLKLNDRIAFAPFITIGVFCFVIDSHIRYICS